MFCGVGVVTDEVDGTKVSAFKQVAMAGNDAQRKRTAELLDETRKKIYALLASDES